MDLLCMIPPVDTLPRPGCRWKTCSFIASVSSLSRLEVGFLQEFMVMIITMILTLIGAPLLRMLLKIYIKNGST